MQDDQPSVPLADLYEQLEGGGIDYDLRPYTAPGRLTLLTAPPKVGKSTFAALYAHAKASASEFLAQRVGFGPVLHVAPDENPRDVARRYRAFGTPGELVHVWTGWRRDVSAIAQRALDLEVTLVVLDTLLRVAGVEDENDNAAWDRWLSEARDYIHSSEVPWLALHHDRKSGGKDGAAIRGASAIFGGVDVALSLERVEEFERRRTLTVQGSRLDYAEPLVVQLDPDEATYQAVGDARVVSILQDGALERVRGVLTPAPKPVSKIADNLRTKHPDRDGDLSQAAVRNRLEKLRTAGLADRHGEGGRRDPYQYFLTRSQDPEETSEGRSEGVESLDDTRSPTEQSEGSPGTRSLPHDPYGSEEVSVTLQDEIGDLLDRGQEAAP